MNRYFTEKDIQMTHKQMRTFNIFAIRQMQIKPQCEISITTYLTGWLKLKKEKLKILKDAKMRRNWISLAKGNVKWYRHSESFL